MNIFVGNLSYQATEEDLNKLFSEFGEVASTKVVTDQYTGRSRGFAFVNMDNDAQAQHAIEKLHNTMIHQMAISVNEARPREDRRERDGFSRSSNSNGFRKRY